VDLDITEDSIEVTAHRLSRGTALGGTDTHALQQWLLHFKKSSQDLRQTTADIVDWLANSFLPWAAYRAFMAGRLVALDKCPGVCPIRVGKTWRWLAAKATLLSSGSKAKEVSWASYSSVLAWKPASKAESMHSTRKRGGFCLLMHPMHSTS
jgi:hypothetical protein